MASSGTCSRAIIMFLVVLTISTFETVIGKPERRERHINDDNRSIEGSQSTDSFLHSSPNSLSRESDESESLTGKRVSQRLMGGHIRYETTTVSPIDDDSDDDSDEASWDDGLAISSAGNGKERSTKVVVNDEDDEKKTLSQQVKEGKYGLIQNEIYPTRPKRPGIISYLSNPEVPRDNAKNLGGLDEDEIWLAENHVLVLRGGNFPDHEKDNRGINSGIENDDWRPIDDYKAPKRQVKIPSRPKIPPPFPIQLRENGPVQIIGVNDTTNDGESTSDYENEPRQDKHISSDERSDMGKNANASKDTKSQENTTRRLINDDANDGRTKSGHVPPRNQGVIGPFYPSLPPGAVFVVPPSNHSDYDDDDQSIYYPPPYSFYYKQDNSTPVPPGPLVPGIVLPPPPDFFSGIEDKKPNVKPHPGKYPKRTGTTSSPSRPSPSHYPPRKGTSKANKPTTSRSIPTTTKHASHVASFTMKPLNAIKYKSTTTGRSTLKPIRVQDVTSSFVQVTTPAISEASNLKITEYYTPRTNEFVNSNADKPTTTTRTTTKRTNDRWNDNVSSKPVPLVTYYSSSTPSSVDEPIEATPISSNSVITTDKQRGTENQASYYFYEETNDDVVIGTTPNPTIYYRTTTEEPYYNDDAISQRQKQKIREREKNSYGLELLEPVSKTSSRYQYADSGSTVNSLSSSRSKGHRMITESSPIYYDTITERPRDSQLKSYYATTERPNYRTEDQQDDRWNYNRPTKPKPIYQYSYEAADYYKRGKQQQPQQNYYKTENQRPTYYKQENLEPTPAPQTFDEWQDVREDNQEPQNQQYDYEDSEILTERPAERENNNYRNRLPISYPSTTSRAPIEPTPNPQHAYYTRQEEQLLDDVTKEYFTNFGKKIRNKNFPNTTPIYGKSRVVTARPDYGKVESYGTNDYEDSRQTNENTEPRVRVHYGDQAQRPYSLNDDLQVNYKDPLPSIEPESEWIPGYEPKQRVNLPIPDYRQHHTETNSYANENLSPQHLTPLRHYDDQQRIIEKPKVTGTNFVEIGDSRNNERANYPTRPINLVDDIAVNYRDPLPAINPDAEYIERPAMRNNKNGDKASYFAYRLPGDSGHFYFLTPQAINQRQDSNDGYLYQRPRGTRFSRQRRRGPRNV